MSGDRKWWDDYSHGSSTFPGREKPVAKSPIADLLEDEEELEEDEEVGVSARGRRDSLRRSGTGEEKSGFPFIKASIVLSLHVFGILLIAKHHDIVNYFDKDKSALVEGDKASLEEAIAAFYKELEKNPPKDESEYSKIFERAEKEYGLTRGTVIEYKGERMLFAEYVKAITPVGEPLVDLEKARTAFYSDLEKNNPPKNEKDRQAILAHAKLEYGLEEGSIIHYQGQHLPFGDFLMYITPIAGSLSDLEARKGSSPERGIDEENIQGF